MSDVPQTLHDARQLLAEGRLPAAQAQLERACQQWPGSVPLALALADVLSAQRNFTAALVLLRTLEGRSPEDATPIDCRIGGALAALGERAGALEILQAAVRREPQSAQAHFHLAETQLICGQFAEASRHAAQAVRLGAAGEGVRQLQGAALAAAGDLPTALVVMRAADGPARPVGDYLRVLGSRLARAGLRIEALQCYRLVLEQDPGDLDSAHIAAALERQNPAHPQAHFVRRHFDAFAATFDAHLDGLGYRAPRELKDALTTVDGPPPPWDTLDLGCGTGLVAEALAGLTARLDGVDVSPRMIERARERGRYDSLSCDELLDALARSAPAAYDLVTAADVFIYVGRLDAVIAAIRRVLKPGGLLAFTAEDAARALDAADPAAGYWLQYTGRYAHSAAYLRALAAGNGFEERLQRTFGLRMESGQSVAGWMTVWSARA